MPSEITRWLFAEILLQNFIICSIGFDAGKSCIEFVYQFLLICGEHCKTVLGAFIGCAIDQLKRNTVGFDIIRHNGCIVKAGSSLSADDSLIDIRRTLKISYGEIVGIFEALSIFGALGTDFDSDGLAGEISKSGNLGSGGYSHGLGGTVVAI